jgi:hypothetical protein
LTTPKEGEKKGKKTEDRRELDCTWIYNLLTLSSLRTRHLAERHALFIIAWR